MASITQQGNYKILQLTNVAAMTALRAKFDGQKIHVKGYTTAYDEGDGDFHWDATSLTTQDLGTVFQQDDIGASAGRWKRDVVDVLNANAFGGLVAAITGLGSTEKTVIISDTQTLTDDLTIPANVTLDIKKNGLISIASGKTVTLTGEIVAGDYQIFSGDGVFDGYNREAVCDWFGIVADANDQLAKINKALNTFDSLLFTNTSESYKISDAIEISSGQKIRGVPGSRKVILNVTDNTKDCIHPDAGSSNIEVSNFELYTTASGSGGGITMDGTDGGTRHLYRDLTITGFGRGLEVFELWWNNYVDNVLFSSCGVSIYCNCPSGQSINNYFSRIYSNDPTTRGIELLGVKTWTFDCLNMGMAATAANGAYVKLTTNSIGVTIVGGNFERTSGSIQTGFAGIDIWDGCSLTLVSPTFASNVGQGATAYEVKAQNPTGDPAYALILNPEIVSQGANMGNWLEADTSQISVLGGEYSGLKTGTLEVDNGNVSISKDGAGITGSSGSTMLSWDALGFTSYGPEKLTRDYFFKGSYDTTAAIAVTFTSQGAFWVSHIIEVSFVMADSATNTSYAAKLRYNVTSMTSVASVDMAQDLSNVSEAVGVSGMVWTCTITAGTTIDYASINVRVISSLPHGGPASVAVT